MPNIIRKVAEVSRLVCMYIYIYIRFEFAAVEPNKNI